ncbi:MAG: protein kinase, partial [Planctomyces sp.]
MNRRADLPEDRQTIGDAQGVRIGEGGFGTVYMAEQTEPVRRRVALKIIKPGMDSKAIIARFEAERQALALMDHPHIARVLDG